MNTSDTEDPNVLQTDQLTAGSKGFDHHDGVALGFATDAGRFVLRFFFFWMVGGILNAPNESGRGPHHDHCRHDD